MPCNNSKDGRTCSLVCAQTSTGRQLHDVASKHFTNSYYIPRNFGRCTSYIARLLVGFQIPPYLELAEKPHAAFIA
eukprot:1142613-Pelagomonas_calceolata.AAC.4